MAASKPIFVRTHVSCSYVCRVRSTNTWIEPTRINTQVGPFVANIPGRLLSNGRPETTRNPECSQRDSQVVESNEVDQDRSRRCLSRASQLFMQEPALHPKYM
jgi:hypothetical protein